MATTPRIGTMIRRARERKRMSQKDLAKALGVSRSAVNAWENDRAWPQNSIGALEEILGISLAAEPPGPAGVVPGDEWEAIVLADDSLPVKEREEIVKISRQARARLYPALEPRPAGDGREAPAPAPEPRAG